MAQTTGDTGLERAERALDDKHESGAISEADYESITALLQYERGQLKPSTVRSHVYKLSTYAERTDTALMDQSTDDIVASLKAMQGGTHPGVKDDGIIVKNYVSALRKFHRYHDSAVDDADIEVDEDYGGRELKPSDMLYKDEVDDLLHAARRASVRDEALIALALATEQRVDAIRTLRLRHVETDGPTMQITLNTDEGSLKGASGSKPLLWAKHYVRPWVESHPYRNDPDAALFPPSKGSATPREPMARRTIGDIISTRAKEAGIDKSVYPHLLRHTAITRMVVEGLTEQAVKNIVGWDADSSQFGTYVHLADELQTDSVRQQLGLPTSETGTPDIGRPTLDTCPSCNDMVPDGNERCPTCQTPLTTIEAVEGEAETEPTAESVGAEIEEMPPEERDKLAELLQR
jgi:integrase/recombinase XerD